MFGSHLSIAGSMVSALDEGARLGLDTVQVFTKNQQQWQAKPLDPGMVRAWHARMAELGWQGRVVSHASYLINLAAPADELWHKSIALMRIEIERCEELGIPFLVHHPGAYTTSSLEQGLARIAAAYRELFSSTRGFRTVSCLEGTAGAGTTIGGPFEHLGRLRELIAEATGAPERIGFCLDSCHLHAAGYDMSTRSSATSVLDAFDARCGIGNLKVWHLNDSKGTLGSHLDRHAHIGEGEVGRGVDAPTLADSGFAAIVNHPAFAGVPKILETPKEEGGKPDAGSNLAPGRWDTINIARLRSLMPGFAEPQLTGLRERIAPPAAAKKPAAKKSAPARPTKSSLKNTSAAPKPRRAKTNPKTGPKADSKSNPEATSARPRLSGASGQQSRPAGPRKAGSTQKGKQGGGNVRTKGRKPR
ncbi:MAG: deoxyribonuclease IV [Planctomycetota bacterium]|nr:deoxyribonuclease IV [Planctomycetota bacterium]